MEKRVKIIGAGLAGSEAALQLADRGIASVLVEMRPAVTTPVHQGGECAELVCSNSLKSTNPESAAGMLKRELEALGSHLLATARMHSVAAGGALAVDRNLFSRAITTQIDKCPLIVRETREACDLAYEAKGYAALIVASGPLTSKILATSLEKISGRASLSFFDAAAPIVMADSLDHSIIFSQSRYEQGGGDYLNAPFSREEYDIFIDALVHAERVVKRSFETKELFQACQPIEEIARAGHDAPRFGALKPVGLIDPATERRPWAAVQLRAEDAYRHSFNLVGFQTNLTFPEQQRVFSLIPGLQHAEFARYGVMHRNTFIDAPRLLDASLRLVTPAVKEIAAQVFIAGQLSGTEGYVEAIRSGLHAAISVAALLRGCQAPAVPHEMAFGALLAYATDANTRDYQPSHVNFALMPPLDPPIKHKRERYAAYARRGEKALLRYCEALAHAGLAPVKAEVSL